MWCTERDLSKRNMTALLPSLKYTDSTSQPVAVTKTAAMKNFILQTHLTFQRQQIKLLHHILATLGARREFIRDWTPVHPHAHSYMQQLRFTNPPNAYLCKVGNSRKSMQTGKICKTPFSNLSSGVRQQCYHNMTTADQKCIIPRK